MNFNVCSVSSYKANVKNLQREGVGGLWTVDNGFAPPGYLKDDETALTGSCDDHGGERWCLFSLLLSAGIRWAVVESASAW